MMFSDDAQEFSNDQNNANTNTTMIDISAAMDIVNNDNPSQTFESLFGDYEEENNDEHDGNADGNEDETPDDDEDNENDDNVEKRGRRNSGTAKRSKNKSQTRRNNNNNNNSAEEEVNKDEQNDEDEEDQKPYLPKLKTSIIQMVLNINSVLIRLCKEFQNSGLVDDPQYAIYQMRLQSNLTYLAAVADHYLVDPLKNQPDLRPIPIPTNIQIDDTDIHAKLKHARKVYDTYAKAYLSQQLELSKQAKAKLKAQEQAQYSSLEGENQRQRVVDLLKGNRVDNYQPRQIDLSEGACPSYKPFPPFQVPEEIKLPPHSQSQTRLDRDSQVENREASRTSTSTSKSNADAGSR